MKISVSKNRTVFVWDSEYVNRLPYSSYWDQLVHLAARPQARTIGIRTAKLYNVWIKHSFYYQLQVIIIIVMKINHSLHFCLFSTNFPISLEILIETSLSRVSGMMFFWLTYFTTLLAIAWAATIFISSVTCFSLWSTIALKIPGNTNELLIWFS